MLQAQVQPRIDLADLKTQIEKSIGLARSKLYFRYLNRFLSQKLSKPEFDKLCLRTVGKENLVLHNQLIRSILKNAYYGKGQVPLKSGRVLSRNRYQSPAREDGHSNGHCRLASHDPTLPPVWSNGGRERTYREQSSSLAPNGKTRIFKSHQSEISINDASVHINTQRLLEVENNGGTGFISHTKLSSSPVRAPLGIPFPFWGSQMPVHSRSFDSCSNSGDLRDPEGLSKRMEQIAGVHGLGVSVNCVNLLNNGLEVYLKQLIGSCIELVDARCGVEGTQQQTAGRKQLIETQKHLPVSLVDFRVAMELNPQQLGEHWSVLLEKICMQQECEE
ncbi:hypothetical protein ACHQM5_030702 [Ranunculus cassubicifolius]